MINEMVNEPGKAGGKNETKAFFLQRLCWSPLGLADTAKQLHLATSSFEFNSVSFHNKKKRLISTNGLPFLKTTTVIFRGLEKFHRVLETLSKASGYYRAMCVQDPA